MTSKETASEPRFEPPGPGSWDRDTVHFPRPLTRYWAEMHPEPCKRGTREFTQGYGILLDCLEYRYVNGFAYKSAIPIEPAEAPKRFKRAEEVFQTKYWREQVRDWDENVKPASMKAHMALQAVDPDALADADLAAHLKRCRDRHAE